jgi:PAS domain S-box-containing protein
MAMLENAVNGAFETDNKGELTYVNRAYCMVVGRTPSELLGSGWYNTITADEKDKVTKEFRDAIKNHREWEMTYTISTRDTEKRQVTCRAYRYQDSSGNTMGYLGMMSYLGPENKSQPRLCN